MKILTPEKYQQYLDALLVGDRSACQKSVTALLDAEMPLVEIYEKLFKNSLYQVGDLWESNQISVSTEYIATALTENLLTLVQPRIFETERIGKSVMLACVESEHHPIGAKMVADIFELYGWDSYYLGTNLPVSDLLAMIEAKKPDLLGLSVTLLFNIQFLEKTLDEVTRAYPDLAIIVGGQAFLEKNTTSLDAYPNIKYIPSLASLIESVLKT